MPHLNDLFATGAPACTPSLDEGVEAWHTITRAADPWLDTLTTENMAIRQLLGHTDLPEFVGNIDDEAPYQPE